MSYTAKDQSTASGQPIECYAFEGTNGNFYHTSYHKPVTVDGDVYTPLAITRTSIETTISLDTPVTMDFNIPVESELAKRYGFMTTPRNLKVTVKRVQEGDDFATDFKVEWPGGEALGFSLQDKWLTIETGSVFQNQLASNLSAVYFQRSCNHILYDERCKVSKAAHTHSATVTKIQGAIITVDNDTVANDVLNGGTFIIDRTDEVQSLVKNTDNVIRLGARPVDIVVGDAVTMIKGCDHIRLRDCKLKFNNVVNYGGFDFIPTANLFANINRSVTVSTNTKVVTAEKTITETIPPKSGWL